MLKICKKLQEKRFVFVKILAIIIPENGAKVSKIKCLRLNQQTLIRISGASTYNRRSIGKTDEPRRITYGEGSLFDEMNEKLDISANSFGEEAVSCLIIYAKEMREENLQYEQLYLE